MKKTDYYEIYRVKLKSDNYSKSTIDTYSKQVQLFLDWLQLTGVSPTRVKASDFQEYLDNYECKSYTQKNQAVSALKLFYEKTLNKKYFKVRFDRPRKERSIPFIMDRDLLVEKIDAIENLKHRVIVALPFSTGMRISEVVNLKIEDIDSDQMQIHIKRGKGNKDRIVPLTDNMLDLLRKYYKTYRPKVYLLNGQNGGKYSKTSCRNVVHKHVSPKMKYHGLRHSTATYMIEENAPLPKVQRLLGHNNSKTTERYIHLSNKAIQGLPQAY